MAHFKGTAPTDPHPKEKSSPAFLRLRDSKGQLKALTSIWSVWSPSQGRNSASSSQKFAYIKRRKSVNPNTEQTKADANRKATYPKSRMHPRREVHQSLNNKIKMCRPSTACGVLTDNIAERR